MANLDYRTHITILVWFNIGFSILVTFIGLFGLFFLTGIGIATDDPEAARILSFVGGAGAVFLIILALPGFLAGYGLLNFRPWGRILAMVVAVFDLFCIPVGTAIGIYALWVLTGEEAGTYFAESGDSQFDQVNGLDN